MNSIGKVQDWLVDK